MKTTVPLFEAKSKFSEYVALVENGGIVAVTKHGKTAAIIVNPNDFSETARDIAFEKRFEAWRKIYGGLTDDEVQDFMATAESLRTETEYNRKNPFLGDD